MITSIIRASSWSTYPGSLTLERLVPCHLSALLQGIRLSLLLLLLGLSILVLIILIQWLSHIIVIYCSTRGSLGVTGGEHAHVWSRTTAHTGASDGHSLEFSIGKETKGQGDKAEHKKDDDHSHIVRVVLLIPGSVVVDKGVILDCETDGTEIFNGIGYH